MKSDLFIIPRPVRNPKLRLFCFPYAGGSASIYYSWAQQLGEGVELVAVQPPGRASRMLERPHDHMDALVDELQAHAAYVSGVPYLFFGHSLGSRVAFAFASRLLAEGYPGPRHLIGSGSRAPHLATGLEPIYELPTPQFLAKLKSLNGTPQEALANAELMELLLPVLRADFRMADRFRARKLPIDCPITVLAGTEDDEIRSEHLDPWAELSTQATRFEFIAGDHFFINSQRDRVVGIVNAILTAELSALESCSL